MEGQLKLKFEGSQSSDLKLKGYWKLKIKQKTFPTWMPF